MKRKLFLFCYLCFPNFGELAQLARALHWQCRGHRFESGILHFIQESFSYNSPKSYEIFLFIGFFIRTQVKPFFENVAPAS